MNPIYVCNSSFLLNSVFAEDLSFKRIHDPNAIRHYISKTGLENLENSFKISTDLSLVSFYLWTPEGLDMKTKW